jgi:predicted metal-dependent RNase
VTYLVHGEPASMEALQRSIRETLGWHTHMPAHGETVQIGDQA